MQRPALLLPLALALDKGGAPCFDDHACNLNGACEGGACVCDRGWTGANCSALNLQPARARAGFRLANASSWGGSALRLADGRWHMFAAVMLEGCGLTTWRTNSFTARAVADAPDGAYAYADAPIGPWSHNPTAAVAADGALLVLAAGYGAGDEAPPPERCAPSGCCGGGRSACGMNADHACNATSPPWPQPNATGGRDPRAAWANFSLWASASGDPSGPWELAWADVLDGAVRQATPALWTFANGTVVALFAGGGLLRSAEGAGWRGPYARWGAGDALYWGCPGGGEDPFLWVDARGRWHCLFHAPPYPNLTRAGGHAFSADGVRWAVSPEPAYRGDAVDELTAAGGAAPRYLAKRERPHLLFGADGAPVALSTGVCEVAAGFDPATDPWGEARWAACNDNPWPGYFDRTFTHVQPIAP